MICELFTCWIRSKAYCWAAGHSDTSGNPPSHPWQRSVPGWHKWEWVPPPAGTRWPLGRNSRWPGPQNKCWPYGGTAQISSWGWKTKVCICWFWSCCPHTGGSAGHVSSDLQRAGWRPPSWRVCPGPCASPSPAEEGSEGLSRSWCLSPAWHLDLEL